MAGRRLVRDAVLSQQPLFRRLLSPQLGCNSRLRLSGANDYPSNRQFSIFNEFSKKIKGETTSNEEFQKSVKELKDKAGELKGLTEELKVRTKQTTEKLYKQVDGVWTEAEETAKKVSANVKEKITAAKEEVSQTFGAGKQEPSSSADNSSHDGTKTASSEEPQSGSSDAAETLFGRFKSGVASATPKFSSAFQKLKDAKVVDIAKKGYEIVKDELSGKPVRRKRMQKSAASGPSSDRMELVILPSSKSRWGKKWDKFKEKMQGHPVFKRVSKISEPVVERGQEFKEEIQDRLETSDSPFVHKILDMNDRVFGETDSAAAVKEIKQRDPYFSLPEFVAEVQEVIRPVLEAYNKCDVKVLEKYCSPEMVERCKAERKAYESQGIFFETKITHINDADIREIKMSGTTPTIIVSFQTDQVHIVRDRHGAVTEGGNDNIHKMIYAWALQQMEPEESTDEAVYGMWRLREMQQLGIRALI